MREINVVSEFRKRVPVFPGFLHHDQLVWVEFHPLVGVESHPLVRVESHSLVGVESQTHHIPFATIEVSAVSQIRQRWLRFRSHHPVREPSVLDISLTKMI